MPTTNPKAKVNNFLFILDDLINHLDESDFHQYDDADDMYLAKKEVMKILENLIKRREK